MACPICKEKKKFFSVKVKDYEYDIRHVATYVQCKSCESIYRTNPQTIKSQEKIIYSNKNYLPSKGNPIYDILKGIYAEYEKKIILENLRNKFFNKKVTVLDIACGKGYLINKFSKEKTFICFGIDINSKTIKKDNVNFINSSYNNIDLIKKIRPDVIIINNFIEHIENLIDIHKIINQMKKKSYLIILTPDGNSSARKIFSNYWSGFHSPRHKVIFNTKSIRTFFSNNKKINFRQTKIYDPFTNLVSISNIIKQIAHKFVLSDFLKVILFLLYIFVDYEQKNRILMVGEKT